MIVERFISIGFLVFGAYFLVISLQLESRPNVEINPGAWPAFLTLMMIVLGIVLLIRSMKAQPVVVEEEEESDLLAEGELVYPKNFIYLIIVLALYIICLNYLGFIISTILVLFVTTAFFGMKKWSSRIVTSVVATAGFILLFPILLQAPFPRGVGIFRTISLLFY